MSHLSGIEQADHGGLHTALRLFIDGEKRVVAFKDGAMLKFAKQLAVHGVKRSEYTLTVHPGNFGTCSKNLTSYCFYCGNDWYVYAERKQGDA